MVNTSIGEVGIEVGEKKYFLRPSFFALSKLGSPAQIVERFREVTRYFEMLVGLKPVPHWFDPLCAFQPAFYVIDACLVDGDATDLTGTIKYSNGQGKHVKRALPLHDIIVLAFHLMRYGIYGKPKPRKKRSDSDRGELTEFDPSEAVGIAIGQFNMAPKDAWNLTMIEYQRAWDGKYPEVDDTKEQQRISKNEYSDLMDWHDKIKAAQIRAESK